MSKQNKSSFIVYESFYNAILEMEESVQLEAFKALFEFGLYDNLGYSDNPMIKIMLHVAKENIISSKNKYAKSKKNGEAGKKAGSTGGRPQTVDVEKIQELKELGYKQTEVSEATGISLRSVKTYWNIVQKPTEVQEGANTEVQKGADNKVQRGIKVQKGIDETIGNTENSLVQKPLNVNDNANDNVNENISYPKKEYVNRFSDNPDRPVNRFCILPSGGEYTVKRRYAYDSICFAIEYENREHPCKTFDDRPLEAGDMIFVHNAEYVKGLCIIYDYEIQ